MISNLVKNSNEQCNKSSYHLLQAMSFGSKAYSLLFLKVIQLSLKFVQFNSICRWGEEWIHLGKLKEVMIQTHCWFLIIFLYPSPTPFLFF